MGTILGEWEAEMNGHEENIRIRPPKRANQVVDTAWNRRAPALGDLVVDLTGIMELDVTSLALLLTAQQNAQKEDRAIWLAGVPMGLWQALHSMGLGRFFKPFPMSAAVPA